MWIAGGGCFLCCPVPPHDYQTATVSLTLPPDLLWVATCGALPVAGVVVAHRYVFLSHADDLPDGVTTMQVSVAADAGSRAARAWSAFFWSCADERNALCWRSERLVHNKCGALLWPPISEYAYYAYLSLEPTEHTYHISTTYTG